MKTIRLYASAALFFLSGKKIITGSLDNYIKSRKTAWEQKAKEIQKRLDDEHSRGFGISALDGKAISYQPYTSLTLRNI